MKKFILAFAALSMVATPAMAGHRDHQYRGYERHRNRVSTGEAVAIGIGALILGAAIANNNNRNVSRVERYEHPINRRQVQQVCQDVIQYDYYGNPYVASRTCWYQ